jgi:biopolymer transport protein ExbD
MARKLLPDRPAGIHEPNLTPLIDVSLVLVVILLVATPLALQSGIAVSHAPASGRAGGDSRVARIEISVVDDAHVIVNRAAVARADLAATLAPLLAQSSTREVVVRCADGVTHGAFVGVLDQAKGCGATHIAVVAS